MANFDFSKSYILENKKVKLCSLSKEHISKLETLAKSSEIWTYFLEKGKDKESFERYIKNIENQYKQQKHYPFVIFDIVKNEVAGITQLYDFIPELKSIKIGHTWIGKTFQGMGINRQSKFLLFQFLFEKMEIERIGFGVHSENMPSIKALTSFGCRQEGVLRNFLYSTLKNDRVDLLLFSILKAEWFESVKESLQLKINN